MLEQTFLGNSVAEWLIAAVVAAASTLTYLIIRAFFRRRGQEPAHEDSEGNFIAASENLLGRLARRANLVSGLGLGVAFGNNVLTLSPTATVWIERLLIVVTIYQVGVWGSVVARQAVERIGTAKRSEDTRRSTTGILNYLANVLVWSVVLLFGLENLGIDVSTIIAGLGVSGIAIALATQTILGDIIASISLVFDEPFQTGDFIVVGNTVGTVQRIGVRTTRIKALSGELLVVSNNDLLKSRIQNFKPLEERRIVFHFGVVYGTKAATLREIPGWIQAIIEGVEKTRFDRCHFQLFGESDLRFETVFFVLDPDYKTFMDIQQAINLGICEKLEEHSVDFAFPTRTLYHVTPPADVPLQPAAEIR